MTNEFLTFLFFFIPIVLFGLNIIIFYAIGLARRNPEMIKLTLVSLISFFLSVLASEFFYGKSSMLDMAKAISFSNVNGIIFFAMVLLSFFIMVIEVLKTIFWIEN